MPGDADLIFCNGTIFDGHEFLPAGTAVRVRAASIVAAEPDADARAAAGPGTEIVDLAGGTLLPGFIDAHMHPVFAGDQLRRCDLSGAVTLPEYLAIIRDYVDRNPGDGWVTGGGWSMEAFPGGIPTAAPLDEIASDRPVYLPNRDGHGAWVNSKALQLAGINRDTLDPADGRIERDADGSPVGMLQEGAQNLVSRLLPELTEEDRDEALRLAQEHLLAVGITGWQDAIIGRSHKSGDPLPAYVRAADRGTLRATVVGALWWDRHRGLDQLAELIEERDLAPDGRFRATSVKMMLDGVAENHTAAMLEPYLDGHGCQTEVTGLDFIDPAELPRFVTALDQAGFQVHFHALGDRAVRNALDAIQAARPANRRHRPAPPPRPPAGRAPGRRRTIRATRCHGQHPGPVGRARTADGRADGPVPRRAPLDLAVPVPLAARLGRGPVWRQRLAGQQPQPAVGRARRGQPRRAGRARPRQ